MNPAFTRKRVPFQEAGLLLVIVALGALLAVFGGRVSMPELKRAPDGSTERVMVEKNKFLNSRTLIQLAKDTSFVAIMAIGATFIIVSGGIDLSVGAIYALASVLGAVVFHRFGPDAAIPSPGMGGVCLGILTCLGAATL